MSEDITAIVEREVAMEQRLGITISGLYAFLNDEQIVVNGEFKTLGGTVIDDLKLIANLYDARGRIIYTDEHLVLANKFDGLESFSMMIDRDEDQPQVTRILVFAKKW